MIVNRNILLDYTDEKNIFKIYNRIRTLAIKSFDKTIISRKGHYFPTKHFDFDELIEGVEKHIERMKRKDHKDYNKKWLKELKEIKRKLESR